MTHATIPTITDQTAEASASRNQPMTTESRARSFPLLLLAIALLAMHAGAQTIQPSPTGGPDDARAKDVQGEKFIPVAPKLEPFTAKTDQASVQLSGWVPLGKTVRILGPEADLAVPVAGDGTFSADVPLKANLVNHIYLINRASGIQSPPTIAAITRDNQAPTLFVDNPLEDDQITTATVDVLGRVGDLLCGDGPLTVSVESVTAGQTVPAVVTPSLGTDGTYLAEAVPLALDAVNTLVITATDQFGNLEQSTVIVEQVTIPATAPKMTVTMGNAQSGPIGTKLPTKLKILMQKGNGTPFPGKIVNFEVSKSDGLLNEEGQVEQSQFMQVKTNASGLAAVEWILGTDAGSGNNRVSVTSKDVLGTVGFCASATALAPQVIAADTGGNQRVELESPALEPLSVWVSDGENSVAGLPVFFTVEEGDGTIDGGSIATVFTDPTGHAAVQFLGGMVPGINRIQATFTGNPGSAAQFFITAIERDTAASTSFSGLVIDNAGLPVQGATVELEFLGEGPVPTVESALDGSFVLADVPYAGPGHLIVDATSAYHIGGAGGIDVAIGTYPKLVFITNVVTGTDNSLPDAVVVPPLDPNGWESFDATDDVDLTVASLPGLKFTVDKNTVVTLADGTVIGPDDPGSVQLSVNAVHVDDIPMPLPNGSSATFAWTLQPASAHFDPPVRIEMPNLTGLAPGEAAKILSYDHDTESFEVVATGSVNADGAMIASDPGAGIAKSGWGGIGQNWPPGDAGGDGDNGGPPGTDGTNGPPGGDNTNCAGSSGLDPVYLFSGEFYLHEVDMRIKGRGIDFSWDRTYRSKESASSIQGNSWTFSYDINVEPDGQEDLALRNGHGRKDIYKFQEDGTWAKNGHSQFIIQEPDGSYTLSLADGGTWRLLSLSDDAAGKISSIEDRHGNSLSFEYDSLSRLVRVIDTLGRQIDIAYNLDDRIQSVTDFTGRVVTYEYYASGSRNGNPGDLRSMTSPPVTGTSTLNDFPLGKSTLYTYSTGFQEDERNHNLLTVTDAAGQTYLRNTYSATSDRDDPQYDRLIRQSWGGPEHVTDLHYIILPPSDDTQNAVSKTIVNDRMGNVREYFHDQYNHLIVEREYTGRADPSVPTTETSNRPSGKLRPSDPEYFETRYEYNAYSLKARIIDPMGNETRLVYEHDLNPAGSPLSASNVRVKIRTAGSHPQPASQSSIVEMFEYNSGMAGGGGCCGSTLLTRYADGRGNVTTHEYDSAGNRIRTVYAEDTAQEDYEYNVYGQLTAYIAPGNGSGYRRRDEHAYYDSGPQAGYRSSTTVDVIGEALISTFEYDARGNLIKKVDPRGGETAYEVNQLDQVVRVTSPETEVGSGVRYVVDSFYDANDNVVRTDIENRDGDGNVIGSNPWLSSLFEYDVLNHIVVMCREVGSFDVPRNPPQLDCQSLPGSEFASTEYEYDANRNRVVTRYGEAAEGRMIGNLLRVEFDERDLPFRETAGPRTSGETTTQYDYDGNGNLTHIRTGVGVDEHVDTNAYDSLNRLVLRVDAMGNAESFEYDEASNLLSSQTSGETHDTTGASGNTLLRETTYEYDRMDRPVKVSEAFFDVESGQALQGAQELGVTATEYSYSPQSELLSVVDDNGSTMAFTYDQVGRLQLRTDPAGNLVEISYDDDSNPVSLVETDVMTSGAPPSQYSLARSYDGYGRLSSITDSMGQTTTRKYDSRGNTVREVDPLGNITTWEVDGLGRILSETVELTDTGDGLGQSIGQIVTLSEWDDSSRLVRKTDPNGNSTDYVFDDQNRRVAVHYADGAAHTTSYTVHGTPSQTVDRNGTAVSYQYDGLDRLTRRDVVPGAGVDSTVIWEEYQYDGMSRVTSASNAVSLVERNYDSHGNVVLEIQNGATIEKQHDGVGNCTLLTYPSGAVLASSYGSLNRLSGISLDAVQVASIEYAGVERYDTIEFANGVTSSHEYDGSRRMVRTVSTFDVGPGQVVLDDREYSWNAGSLLVGTVNHIGDWERLFTYDSAYRLRQSDILLSGVPFESVLYELDAAGNRLLVQGGLFAGPYSQSSATPEPADGQMNQYTSTPVGACEYDLKGSLLSIDGPGGVEEYVYDYRGQLVEHASGGVITAYLYDALGRHISSASPLESWQYYHDGLDVIEAGDGQGTKVFVYGQFVDDVLMQVDGGGLSFFHADQLGSVVVVTDAVGVVDRRTEFDDYGTPRGEAFGAVAGPEPQFGLGGLWFDSTFGGYRSRVRQLDCRIGRFTSVDPLGNWADPIGLGNAFTYAANSPGNLVDPLGTAACKQVTPWKVIPAFQPPHEAIAERVVRAWHGPRVGNSTPIFSRSGQAELSCTCEWIRAGARKITTYQLYEVEEARFECTSKTCAGSMTSTETRTRKVETGTFTKEEPVESIFPTGQRAFTRGIYVGGRCTCEEPD
jgi:RHS repeat-associated protein